MVAELKNMFPDMDAAIESKWWPLVKAKLDGLGRKYPGAPAASGGGSAAAPAPQG